MFLFLQDSLPNLSGYSQYGVAGAILILVIAFFYFIIRVLPTITAVWKDVRMAEIGVRMKETDAREKEAESRTEQAKGFSRLASALSELGKVLHDSMISNQQQIQKLMILQRVNADGNEQVMTTVNDLSDQMVTISDEIQELKVKKNGPQAKTTPTTA